MSGEGSYAPKSPDLSSFFASPVHRQQQQQPVPPYQQYAQPSHTSYPQQQQQHLQPPQQNYYQPPPQHFSPTKQQPHNPLDQPYLQSPSAQQSFYVPPGAGGSPIYGQQQQQYFPIYNPQHAQQNQQQFALQPTYQPQQGLFSADSYQPPVQGQPLYQQAPSQQSQAATSPAPKTETSAAGMPPRKAAAAAAAAPGSAPAAPSTSVVHTIAPSPVRTKFPTARIKRIMQADEEVGKVSQQTPIAVGKALELFMVALVSKSADVARAKNSKRVTAQMLKQVVESDDQWDFLRDIVKKVDPEEKHGRAPRSSTGGGAADSGAGPSGGSKLKFESDSGDDQQPRKRGRPVGRKKA